MQLIVHSVVFFALLHPINAQHLNEKLSLTGRRGAGLIQWKETIASVPGWAHQIHTKQFKIYANALSKIMKESNNQLHFYLVGACDGLQDDSFEEFFFPNPHWTGVFVEANHKNVADLKNMIISKGPAVINRTFVFDKAVSQKCDTPYVEFLRPLYEELQAETKKEVPHWLRRQIGRIRSPGEKIDEQWTMDKVYCIVPAHILREWNKEGKMIRPHILKIDIESHTKEALKGFIGPDIPFNKLPLIIEFESKNVTEQMPPKIFSNVKAELEGRGYVVSMQLSDTMAILHPDNILPGRGSDVRSTGKGPKGSSRMRGKGRRGDNSANSIVAEDKMRSGR